VLTPVRHCDFCGSALELRAEVDITKGSPFAGGSPASTNAAQPSVSADGIG
jgi:hypothetical protein